MCILCCYLSLCSLDLSYFDCAVRFRQTFEFRSHVCIVFELLSVNLYDVIRRGQHKGVSMATLRSYMHQIFTALQYLKAPPLSSTMRSS